MSWLAYPRGGNWEADESAGLGWDIEGLEQPMRGVTRTRADALLIAAAPEMKEALEMALLDHRDWRHHALRALDKANGDFLKELGE